MSRATPLGEPDLPSAEPRRRSRAVFGGATLVLFLALAVAHTWPLATSPGKLSRNDNGDTVLHEWIMAWVVHQAETDPTHLFDANIFYPERHTLAYSDPLIVESAMAAPLFAAGASPVTAYNVVLILGLALSGWTTCLVVERWTRRWLAGILSGSLMAFNAFTLTVLPQIQFLHLEFLPLALFALDRLLVAPKARHAVLLAVWYVLEALTGNYLLVFTAIALTVGALVRPGDWLGARFRAAAPHVLLASALAVAALAPFLYPYLEAHWEVGLVRTLEGAATYSASLTDYLVAAGTWHFNHWSSVFLKGSALFPGIGAMVLVVAALVNRVAWRDRRARMLLAIGVVAFVLSFGPKVVVYRWLYYAFPLLSGIRAVDRFGEITLAAVAILAGFGLSALMRRWPGRAAIVLGTCFVTVANAEAWRAPLPYTPFDGIPPIYHSLANAGADAVIIGFPFHGPGGNFQNAPLMLGSTRFWKPLVNGYSGFNPPSFYDHVERLQSFPDHASIEYLRQLGVTHIVVRWNFSRLPAIAAFPELRLWDAEEGIRIYQLQR
jgi:hypothetical protein